MKHVTSEALWLIENDLLLAERKRACELWRTNPVITQTDIDAENAAVKWRMKFFRGVDLDKELQQLVTGADPGRPTKGDIVEKVATGRVGHISWVGRHGDSRVVSVDFGTSSVIYDYEEFESYSSKGGHTRWFI